MTSSKTLLSLQKYRSFLNSKYGRKICNDVRQHYSDWFLVPRDSCDYGAVYGSVKPLVDLRLLQIIRADVLSGDYSLDGLTDVELLRVAPASLLLSNRQSQNEAPETIGQMAEPPIEARSEYVKPAYAGSDEEGEIDLD